MSRKPKDALGWSESDYVGAREEGEWRFPPGLAKPLVMYSRRTWARFGQPILLFEHLHEKFGPISHYKLLGQHIIYVNDPEFIQQLLIDQHPAFVKARALQRMKILLGEGLITSDDPIHMRQRRIAAPAFHRQRIAGYAGEIVANATRACEQWQDGTEIDVNDEMMRLSLGIIARTVFNTEITPEVLSVADEVDTIMGLYNYLVAFPFLESVLHWPIPGVRKFRKSKARLDAIVEKMIATRRAMSREELEGQHDLMAMLVAAQDDEGDDTGVSNGMTDAQVRDEVLTIFLAGYETVANALSWTWYLLSENPEVAAKMQEEIDRVLGSRTATLADYAELKYTEQVFAESMRLYPPAWAMGRKSTAPVTLGEYRFPPGTHFFCSQYVVHRSPEYWDTPTEFRPERFTPENKAGRPKFQYFPFGGGRRQCIGEGFAWMEGVFAIATIAQRWNLTFVPRFPVVPEAKITLRPKHPMIMKLARRESQAGAVS